MGTNDYLQYSLVVSIPVTAQIVLVQINIEKTVDFTLIMLLNTTVIPFQFTFIFKFQKDFVQSRYTL